MEEGKKIPLVVSTSHRGVFFGYGVPTDNGTITLEQVRMAIYWSADTRGFPGLAANGPADGSRISPPAPSATLIGVTSVLEASQNAVKEWERGKW